MQNVDAEIVKVKADRLDDSCLIITLRHQPSLIGRLLGRKSYLKTYKGHEDDWYSPPNYKPAPTRVVRLLRQISSSPEFRHLRPNKSA